MTPIRIALLGAPRSGKTRIARELCARLNCQEEAEPGNSSQRFRFDDHPPLLDGISANLHGHGMAKAAQQHAGHYHITLLMGLDLIENAGTVSDGDCRRQFDLAIRRQLASAGIAYQVIYGQGNHRTAQALQALASLHPLAVAAAAAASANGTVSPGPADQARVGNAGWTWMCDKCSDPVCEHRLLTELLSRRSAAEETSLQR